MPVTLFLINRHISSLLTILQLPLPLIFHIFSFLLCLSTFIVHYYPSEDQSMNFPCHLPSFAPTIKITTHQHFAMLTLSHCHRYLSPTLSIDHHHSSLSLTLEDLCRGRWTQQNAKNSIL